MPITQTICLSTLKGTVLSCKEQDQILCLQETICHPWKLTLPTSKPELNLFILTGFSWDHQLFLNTLPNPRSLQITSNCNLLSKIHHVNRIYNKIQLKNYKSSTNKYQDYKYIISLRRNHRSPSVKGKPLWARSPTGLDYLLTRARLKRNKELKLWTSSISISHAAKSLLLIFQSRWTNMIRIRFNQGFKNWSWNQPM